MRTKQLRATTTFALAVSGIAVDILGTTGCSMGTEYEGEAQEQAGEAAEAARNFEPIYFDDPSEHMSDEEINEAIAEDE